MCLKNVQHYQRRHLKLINWENFFKKVIKFVQILFEKRENLLNVIFPRRAALALTVRLS